jgi:hypothetical protein
MSSLRRRGSTGRFKAPGYPPEQLDQKTGLWILKKRSPCQHDEVHEIGQDHDKDGNPMRLIRCQSCGLLMREY